MPADYLNHQVPHSTGIQTKNCCSTACQVRPGYIRYTITVTDDPSIVYGDSNNFNYFVFSIESSAGASCPVSPPMSYDPLLSTETAADYDEFIDNIGQYFIEWLANTFRIGNNTVYRDGDDIVIELSAEDYPLEVDNGVDFCTGDYTFLFCQYQFYDPPPQSPTENTCSCPEGFWGGIIEWTPVNVALVQAMFGTNNNDVRATRLIGGPLTADLILDDLSPATFNTGNPFDVEGFAKALGAAILAGNDITSDAPYVTSQSYEEDGMWHTKICLPLDSNSNDLPWEGVGANNICPNPAIDQLSIRFEDSLGGLQDIQFGNVGCGCNNCTEGKVCLDMQWSFLWWPTTAYNFQGYDVEGIKLFSCYEKLFSQTYSPALVDNNVANNGQINALILYQILKQETTFDTDIEVHLINTTSPNDWRVHLCIGLGNEFDPASDDYWEYHSCCSNNQINSTTLFSFIFDRPGNQIYQRFPGTDPNFTNSNQEKICCNTERPTCICPPGSVGNEVTLNLTDMYNNLQPSQTLHIDLLSFIPCASFGYAANPSATISLGFSAINNQLEFTNRFINAFSQTIHTNPYFDAVNAWFYVEDVGGNDILTIKFCYTPPDALSSCCSRGSGVELQLSYQENSGTAEFQTLSVEENVCCDEDDVPACGCPAGSYTGQLLFTETRFDGEFVTEMLVAPNNPNDLTVNFNTPFALIGMPNITFTTHAESGEQIYFRILSEIFTNGYVNGLTISNVETIVNPVNPAAPSYLMTYCADPGNNQDCDTNPQIEIYGDGSPLYQWGGNTSWGLSTNNRRPDFFGDGQCCFAQQDPSGPQNPAFATLEQELSDCCDTVCRNPKGYLSAKVNIADIDQDIDGRWNINELTVTVNSNIILNMSSLYPFTDAYTPQECAARFAKYINSNFYDDMFVVTNGPQFVLYIKNVDNVQCGLGTDNIEVENRNFTFFDENTLDCCNSEVTTQQITYTDQNIDITPTSISCCPDFNASIEIVECCSDTPIAGEDIASCIECYSAGRNLDPLNYFQNIQIDVDCIQADCFSFKFTDANGNTFYTECYEKVKCERILTICADYPDGYEDCLNNVYGEADEIACQCEDGTFLKYQNCFNIVADLTLEQLTFEEDDNGRKVSRREYRLLSEPVPPSVVEQFENALNSRAASISENGGTFYEYEFEGTVTRNIVGSNMWVIDVLLTRKDECTNNFGCVN